MSEWQKIETPEREPEMRSCFCIGPQNGDPVCPCRMRDRAPENLMKMLERLLPSPPKDGE